MSDFFRGRRRKLGCIALAASCVFTAAWLRSYQYHDLLWLDTTYARGMVYSSTGGINVWCQQPRQFASQYGWQSESVYRQEAGSQAEYWQLVFPLVLLSAYLILWDPLKRSVQ